MKKNIIIVLLFLVLGLGTITFAYVVDQVRTNDFQINIGTPENTTAELSTDLLNKVLIPYNTTPSQLNEVKEYRVYLRVVHVDNISFTITENIPPEYEITYNRTTFLTNENITLTIRLLEPVETQSVIFNLTINF